jgi:hypothetical protein
VSGAVIFAFFIMNENTKGTGQQTCGVRDEGRQRGSVLAEEWR